MILIRCDCCLKEEWIETIGSAPDMSHFMDLGGGTTAVFYPSLRWPKGWILARAPGNFFGESGTPTACSVKCAKDLGNGIVRGKLVVQELGNGAPALKYEAPRLMSGVEEVVQEAPKALDLEGPIIDI